MTFSFPLCHLSVIRVLPLCYAAPLFTFTNAKEAKLRNLCHSWLWSKALQSLVRVTGTIPIHGKLSRRFLEPNRRIHSASLKYHSMLKPFIACWKHRLWSRNHVQMKPVLSRSALNRQTHVCGFSPSFLPWSKNFNTPETTWQTLTRASLRRPSVSFQNSFWDFALHF